MNQGHGHNLHDALRGRPVPDSVIETCTSPFLQILLRNNETRLASLSMQIDLLRNRTDLLPEGPDKTYILEGIAHLDELAGIHETELGRIRAELETRKKRNAQR